MTKMALPVITKRGYLSGQMEIFWLIRCPTRTGVLVNLVTADTWTVWKPAAKDGQWPREAVQQADCHLCVKSKVCCVVYWCHNNRPKLSLSPHTSRSYSFKQRKHSFKVRCIHCASFSKMLFIFFFFTGCPPGFDWSGNSCDKTRDESKMAHPDWLFSSCTLFKVTIIAVLLTAVALISVTIFSYTRTRRTSSRHQELYPT